MKHSGWNFRNIDIRQRHHIFQDRGTYRLQNLSRRGDEPRLCDTRLHRTFVLRGERKDPIFSLALKVTRTVSFGGCRRARIARMARMLYSLASNNTVASSLESFSGRAPPRCRSCTWSGKVRHHDYHHRCAPWTWLEARRACTPGIRGVPHRSWSRATYLV